MKTKGKLLLNYLETQPDVMHWNNKGELIYKGDIIRGLNITDLFRNILSSSNNTSSSKRSRDNISTFERNLFSKALSEANVPYDWIKNAQQLEIIKNYKRNKFQRDDSNIISDSRDDWVMEVDDDIADF